MTYEQITNEIMNKRRFGNATGYEVSKEMLERLNHPENSFKIIHIAGTNGKGSTAAFLTSIFKEAGKTVGTFTSPHLIRFNERIRVNDELISDEDVIRLGEQILELPMELEPTMFDCTFAMAMLYFKEMACDVAIIETGLGGTFDSTNAIAKTPEVSIITSIGLDHTAILGDTLDQIAKNKAGIIKPCTNVVIGKMDATAKAVISAECEKNSVMLFNASLSDEILGLSESEISLGLLGAYQFENAKCAAKAALLFDDISEKNILDGLKKATWPGRMQILSNDPFFMVDGAHNPEGVEALYESLTALFPGEKFIFLVGVMADKDYASMMKKMIPIADSFIATSIESVRALQADELAWELNDLHNRCCELDKGDLTATGLAKDDFAFAISDISKAIAYSKKVAKDRDKKVIAFGSLYFVGELINLV